MMEIVLDGATTSASREGREPGVGHAGGGLTPGAVPVLELTRATVIRDVSEGLGCDLQATEAPCARVWFIYPWGRVRIGDEALDPVANARDLDAERGARIRLEQLGLTELGEHESCTLAEGCDADYLVGDGFDAASGLHFSGRGVARLRAAGWRIERARDYPHVTPGETEWTAAVRPSSAEAGWFEIEMGVEVDGAFVDLLPVLVELLQQSGGAISLPTCHDFTALPLHGSRALVVPTARVEALLDVLRDLYSDDPSRIGRPAIPALVPGYFDRFEAACQGVLTWVDAEDRAPTSPPTAAPPPPRVEPPHNLRATLRGYQAVGLAWMQGLADAGRGGVLADDMGLGKTLQTIAHLCAEYERGHLRKPALVVAPTSLVGNWRRELKRFAPHLEVELLHGGQRRGARRRMGLAQVVITTYGTLALELDHVKQIDWRLLILDEAHAIKNASSRAHRNVSEVPTELRLCLTGTPVENDLEELRAIFEFAVPGLLGSAKAFRTAYRTPIEGFGDEERLEVLRQRVAPYLLRRLKSDVAPELPPKTEVVQHVSLRGRQRDLYEHIRVSAHAKVRSVIQAQGLAGSTVDILAALTRLRQVCCDPRLVLDTEGAPELRSAKLDHLLEMLDTMLPEGRRVLIFSQFTSMLALISQALTAAKIRHLTLTGASRERQSLVDAFERGAADVFLLSLKAAGTGLNLVSADTVIHFDPWWNPSSQAQATDRAYRIGQTRPVFVYDLIVEGSVEAKMVELQRRKRALAEGVLTDRAAGAALTPEDVEGLFAPLDASEDESG